MTLPEPYYADDLASLYLADALDVIDDLPRKAFLVTDPPYGISINTKNASRKGRDYPPVHGDDQPFDPAPWLAWSRIVLFGANNYAARLPASNGWFVWDKLDGLKYAFQGEAELAWTTVIGSVRILRHRWISHLKGSERSERRYHPTQKPVELLARIVRRYAEPDEIILDPYAGSGSTLVAAVREGHRAIGIEIVPQYAEVIATRLRIEAEARRG